jgi:ribosomal protein L24
MKPGDRVTILKGWEPGKKATVTGVINPKTVLIQIDGKPGMTVFYNVTDLKPEK